MQALALSRRGMTRSALVPTMGALHEGHLSLMRLAHEHADQVDVSIFVNPAQFAPGEDLDRYPRTLQEDLDACRHEGVDTVFCPSAAQVYACDHSTNIAESRLSTGLCGRYRPGHFDGVVTVVGKLFNIMLPAVAVFGRKDYQQACVIQRMVRDLNYPVELVLAPIVREPDGLAMSSRNRYLSPGDRARACAIFQGLSRAETDVAKGVTDAETLIGGMRDALRTAGLQAQYIECVDAVTLDEVTCLDRPAVLAVAVTVGHTRLIDNVALIPPAG
jgi:pantoate--beta-alanine ligase